MFCFFSILLFSKSCSLKTKPSFSNSHLSVSPSLKTFSQAHSLKLSPLYLTTAGLTRSSTSLAHQSSTSPTHQPTHFVKLLSRQSTPQTHASDPLSIHAFDPSWPSLLLLTLSNVFSQTLTLNCHLSIPPPLIHTSDPRLQPDSPSSELSLSSSSICLGFLIWVCVCIYKYRINKF